MKQQEDF